MEWQLAETSPITDLEHLRQVLMHNRGLVTPQDQQAFFSPPAPDQLTLAGVGIDTTQAQLATELLTAARAANETVLIMGDYDADGMCATAVMWETLTHLGIKAWPFIPDRERHGYGLSEAALEEALQQCQPSLVITVDNGIVAHQAVAYAQAKGLQVVITDHHLPETAAGAAVLPAAEAIVHTTQLCGTGVAWIFGQHLLQSIPSPKTEPAPEHLDMVAIATIADQVPLLKANRCLVVAGLKALRETRRVGLQALLAAASVDMAQLSETTVNYVIGPRLNAMGRLRHGLEGVRLLCTTNSSRARELAAVVASTNLERQELTQELFLQAKAQVANQTEWPLLIAAAPHFHEGVVGLIAGRLAEEFNKPAIAIAVGESMAKGSARSIPGINIVELIRQVKTELVSVGGHPMAAGFSVESLKVTQVTELLQQTALASIKLEQLTPALPVEAELPFALIGKPLCALQQECAPFGQGNPEPILAVRQLRVLEVTALGAQQQHLKLQLAAAGDEYAQNPLTAMAWNKASKWQHIAPGSRVAIAGVFGTNTWRNKTTVQVRLIDIKVDE